MTRTSVDTGPSLAPGLVHHYLLRLAGSEDLFELMQHCVGRLMIRDLKTVDDLDVFCRSRTRDVSHIRDWLAAAKANLAPWLGKTDECGRPRKLLKFGSVDAIVREADRDMKRWLPQSCDLEAGTEVYLVLDDGWKVVRLLTAGALDAESSEMQHCIGNGGYDGQLEDDERFFFSLRDPAGKPHVTIHVHDGELVELSGKQNRVPVSKYITRLLPLFRTKLFSTASLDGAKGIVADRDGNVHSVRNLPDSIAVDGALYLIGNPNDAPCPLPSFISGGGDIIVDTAAFRGTPRRVEGRIIDMGGIRLGGECEFKPSLSLNLQGSSGVSLPRGFSVPGNLSLNDATNFTLPEGLRVGGMLDVASTDIRALPGDIAVGHLDATNTNLEDLGNLRELKSFHASGSRLKVLPEGFRVSDVNLSDTPVEAIPSDLRVEDYLVASRCSLRLPTLLDVGVSAMFNWGNIDIPAEFECPGSLVMSGSRLRFDNSAIKCGEQLDLTGASAERLPRRIRARQVVLSGFSWAGAPDLELDLETEVLFVSDTRLLFGSGVRVTKYVRIIRRTEVEESFRDLPLAEAAVYLASL